MSNIADLLAGLDAINQDEGTLEAKKKDLAVRKADIQAKLDMAMRPVYEIQGLKYNNNTRTSFRYSVGYYSTFAKAYDVKKKLRETEDPIIVAHTMADVDYLEMNMDAPPMEGYV